MLVIENKDFESVDKLLRKYKKKFDKTRVLQKIRDRKHFTKKSVLRRNQVIKAHHAQLIKSGVIEPK